MIREFTILADDKAQDILRNLSEHGHVQYLKSDGQADRVAAGVAPLEVDLGEEGLDYPPA